MRSEEEEKRARYKNSAKRFNEHVKLAASFLNTLGLGVIGAGLVIPAVSLGIAQLGIDNVIWIVFGLALHLSAQFVLDQERGALDWVGRPLFNLSSCRQ